MLSARACFLACIRPHTSCVRDLPLCFVRRASGHAYARTHSVCGTFVHRACCFLACIRPHAICVRGTYLCASCILRGMHTPAGTVCGTYLCAQSVCGVCGTYLCAPYKFRGMHKPAHNLCAGPTFVIRSCFGACICPHTICVRHLPLCTLHASGHADARAQFVSGTSLCFVHASSITCEFDPLSLCESLSL